MGGSGLPSWSPGYKHPGTEWEAGVPRPEETVQSLSLSGLVFQLQVRSSRGDPALLPPSLFEVRGVCKSTKIIWENH